MTTAMHIKHKKTAQKGMTLVELLIGLVISSIIFAAITVFFSESQKQLFNKGNLADAIADAEFPGVWISRDIRGAFQVTTSHGAYTSSANTIILEIPSVDATESAIADSYDYIIYRLDPSTPTNLLRIIDAADGVSARSDGTRIVADDISTLSFVYYDENNTVTVDHSLAVSVNYTITSSKISVHRGNQPFQETYSSWAKMRNKAFE